MGNVGDLITNINTNLKTFQTNMQKEEDACHGEYLLLSEEFKFSDKTGEIQLTAEERRELATYCENKDYRNLSIFIEKMALNHEGFSVELAFKFDKGTVSVKIEETTENKSLEATASTYKKEEHWYSANEDAQTIKLRNKEYNPAYTKAYSAQETQIKENNDSYNKWTAAGNSGNKYVWGETTEGLIATGKTKKILEKKEAATKTLGIEVENTNVSKNATADLMNVSLVEKNIAKGNFDKYVFPFKNGKKWERTIDYTKVASDLPFLSSKNQLKLISSLKIPAGELYQAAEECEKTLGSEKTLALFANDPRFDATSYARRRKERTEETSQTE